MKPERSHLSPNLEVSQIITGLWQVADLEKGGSDLDLERAAKALVEYASDGFDTFDMADHYGSAELIAGRAREILQSSYAGSDSACPARFHTKWCPKPGVMTPQLVRDAINERADRLGVESIDLLQFHWWDYDDPRYLDALHHLAQLRDEGKIRHLSLTNFDTATLEKIIDGGIGIVSNQVQYSLVDLRPEVQMGQFCQAHDIRLLAYGTLCGGLLSDKYLGQPEPTPGELNTASLSKYKQMIDAWGGWGLFQELLTTLNAEAAGQVARYSLRPTYLQLQHSARVEPQNLGLLRRCDLGEQHPPELRCHAQE